MERDWRPAWQDEYGTGASDDPAYPLFVEQLDRERMNIIARSRPHLERVYSAFRLPLDWDGQAGNGVGGAKAPVLPADIEPGDGPEQYYRPDLRLLNHLPFLDVEETTEAAPKYQRPRLFLKIDSDPDRYVQVERLAEAAALEGDGDGAGRRWSAYFGVSEHVAGFQIKVTGAPQHIIAKTDFIPLVSVPERLPELDYLDNLVATVFMEADRYVTQSWPAQPAASDVLRRVDIDIGERGRLDYVAEGTVIGVDPDGELQHQAIAVWWRDDRPVMLDLARFAYEWYSVPRKAFLLEFRQISQILRIGQFITTIGAGATLEQTNCLVTSVTWDLERGRTEVTTDFAELDFAKFLTGQPIKERAASHAAQSAVLSQAPGSATLRQGS